MTNVDEYHYLWDGSEEGWVLAETSSGGLPVILNTADNTGLIIEDDGTYREVVQEMRDRGVPILPSRSAGDA
jgi:hypothetical protein